ncbi:beta-L-arabinofuranosidase domain-containing protein [Novosphingobium sp. ERW19]|uniref:beta-L-arabinofuranosidase domain-containing protein n=1 Tax=Novosphingobium sp. ERW19 TaxID=2726186 RepID=UPI0014564C81|nr:beta-L-arabinofuranosidase domain-containing protein [Novosphingobium sp. ERW19]NLR38022.1 glycosyl hydrolase [Novosphingobium sp. ERW19]
MTVTALDLGATRRSFLQGASALALFSHNVSAFAAEAAPAPAQAKDRAQPFDMSDITLAESPFLHAQRMTEAYLLRLSPDRMLHNFRRNAGLEPRAPVYGGWESEKTWEDINCHGHTLGHYLSACALAWRATGKAEYRTRIEYVASELAECQKASGSGLVCAFPKGAALVAAHLRGEKITGVPWYTLHKIYAGLRDAAELADSARARDVLLRLADWGVIATRDLSDEAFEAMLETEHGGMNEVYADLFTMTGKAEYRTLAERFSHKAILRPLAERRDHLDGLHANTQVPKIVGFQRVHEVTGAPEYHRAAQFFWQTVTGPRAFATGGHGDNEHFFPIADGAAHVFSAKGSETCCQHNMLKLTRALFMAEPKAEYADYYEGTLYNGILASQDPDSGMATYFQGARPGYMKLYHTPEDSFWCCTGTGMENHVKYRDSIYFHNADTLWVNLFIPSAVRWRGKGAELAQETAFPEQPETLLRWKCSKPFAATVNLRHPAWSRTARVLVNGAEVETSNEPGRFLAVRRTWRNGDTIALQLKMETTAQALPAADDIVAFKYGPLVLAGALDPVPQGSDIVVNERLYGAYNDTPAKVPQLAGDAHDLAETIRGGAKPLEFELPAADGSPVRLLPYYRIAHQRYATYWKLALGLRAA